MNNKYNDRMKELTQGSKLSAFLFKAHWAMIICAILSFILGRWKFGILFLVLAGVSIFFSYQLAGGRSNPYAYKEFNINNENQKEIPNYLFWAVILFICWNPLIAMVAIYKASQVKAYIKAGDHTNALDASKKAKTWCWIAFLSGLLPLIFILIFGIVS